ncbi:unnamed protein product [Paramecium pentaurelia]|uniref:Uncharacterized protein n=1 Tax=Paramecium pentaurelia TaxID=43138 RepID=A0A8S1WNR0_9CILI|nr:unnamed protein product [Paramecium pentaurelia]
MLIPKILEKEIDFQCQSQDLQPPEFVIIDSSLPHNKRFFCKSCGNQRQSTFKIIDFQSLRKSFDELQREFIQQNESIIRLHIESVIKLENILINLKTRQIHQFDNLLLLLKEWITALIDSVSSYSFFKQLDSLFTLQLFDNDQSNLIKNITKIHSYFQAQFDLDLFREQPEFISVQEIFQFLNNLIATQNVELQYNFRVERPKNQFLSQLIQSIRNMQEKQQHYIIEDTICPFGIFYRYKKQFYITKNNKEVKYQSLDGEIVRIDRKNKNQHIEILKKWEQIVYLQWKGQYDNNKQQVGYWTATWKGEIIKDVGGIYNQFGKKEGLWKDLIRNYWSIAQVYEVGQYQMGLKQGNWKFIYKDQEIGCGEYSKQGEKTGKWLELSDMFCDHSKVTQMGEYNQGKKVGRWDILFNYQGNNSKIGGGEYDQAGQGLKIGQWIDISDGFFEDSQVTYNGQYKNGKKVGKWDILFNWNGKNKIGGGFYDLEGEGLKTGCWVDIYDQYQQHRSITYIGEYKNGKKVGKWDIWYNYLGKNNNIGGGLYDEKGLELKIGQWLELSDGFCDYSQVTYQGQYENGQKVGKWDIWFNEEGEKYKIGCGFYDKGGQGLKTGQWIDIHDQYLQSRHITYYGEYRNGKKFGRWNIMYDKNEIGGGQYDEAGQGLKIGKWIDISGGFYEDSQVTYNGEYKNGQKVGKWDIWYKKDRKNIMIGGGSYDEEDQGIKIGEWIEISEGFDCYYEVTYKGSYQNGIKVGTWIEIFQGFNRIKEIQYDN